MVGLNAELQLVGFYSFLKGCFIVYTHRQSSHLKHFSARDVPFFPFVIVQLVEWGFINNHLHLNYENSALYASDA